MSNTGGVKVFSVHIGGPKKVGPEGLTTQKPKLVFQVSKKEAHNQQSVGQNGKGLD
ncbi:hypothetical protein Syun_000243 [Stephania yunnanensis]|uniref:Uncharacterized protein n=1 Tax=Stephania yunnanensis TaxID=152371 RepID=A0AAP0LBM7_9MAGN